MRLPHHLLRHPSGVYHFRLVVPRDLCAAFGRRVLKRSLRTRDPDAAKVGAWALSAGYARIFAGLRGGHMSKPPPIEDTLAALQSGQVQTYLYKDGPRIRKTDGSQADHLNLLETIAAEERLVVAQTEKARMEAEAAKLKLDAAEKNLQARSKEESRARADAQQQALEDAVPHPDQEQDAGRFTLAQVLAKWKARGTKHIARSTADTRRTIIEDFAAHYGKNRLIASVRRRHVTAWTEILETPTDKDRSANGKSTRNNKCSHLKAFFKFAINKGFYPETLVNPAEGVEDFERNERAAIREITGWVPFTLEQLQQLFTPDNLRQTEMPHTRRAMVIGLYTGARVGEVAQLKVESFVVDKIGTQCMKFDGELKNAVSKRKIPVHPDLIRLGILDWVVEQKQRGEERLFPTVSLDGKSKGAAITKGMTNLLRMLRIEADNQGDLDKTVGFHSFRSTVVQELQAVFQEKTNHDLAERRRAYVGHAPYESRDDSSHTGIYMRDWEPHEMQVLEKGIRWGQWLDFEGLKKLLAQTDPDDEAIQQKRAVKRSASAAARKASPTRKP